jgi:general secretion pathway protein D
VSYLDVGLKLDVEPNVYLDDEVGIKVQLEVSSVIREVTGPSNSLAYQIGTRSAGTVLRLRDGETQVLAGLINDEERSSANRLPGLGDIPAIGRLFSSTRDNNSKTEIVLLITPRIVRNVARPDSNAFNEPAGSEASVGAPPLQLKSTAPRTLSLSGGAAPRAAAAPPSTPRPADTPAPTAADAPATADEAPAEPRDPPSAAPAPAPGSPAAPPAAPSAPSSVILTPVAPLAPERPTGQSP